MNNLESLKVKRVRMMNNEQCNAIYKYAKKH